jgi:hypothetical protein
MGSHDPAPRYGAYLLRIWEVRSRNSTEAPVWRFSLEPVHSRERRGFPDLDSLTAFLRSLTMPSSPAAERVFEVDGICGGTGSIREWPA